ncbi:MAG: protein-L-isoaspartate(D-aspartate) O-methyltransferase [Phycisphaerales bacterium]|nr:MAG: protein-L-isoaspartate(D-aspartate) O-methyltransferase [Phycisphaerales bacterium]
MIVMHGRQKRDRFGSDRQRMLDRDLAGRDITDPRVLAAMADVPREKFVPDSYVSKAYDDGPLPIGNGQTISQPYIVALMTQELRIDRECNVLEIGTGCGYQTAILSRLVKKVYTIERIDELAQTAQAVLGRLEIDNVEFHVGDGSCGWPRSKLPPSGRFDRIMITAAVPSIPEPLVGQLVQGGIIVAPVGYGGSQQLMRYQKEADRLVENSICHVRFVKLVGKHGFDQ